MAIHAAALQDPVPSLEWLITDKCNYSCDYCYQRSYAEHTHCSEKTIDAVLKFLSTVDGPWLVKLIGGEPFLHPDFFRMCAKISGMGHKICTTTNFFASLAKLKEFIDICGDKLEFIDASFHPRSVKNVDDFIERAARFNLLKSQRTDFVVTAVLIESEFEALRKIEQRLSENKVRFAYARLRPDGARFARYSDSVEEYIRGKIIKNEEEIRDKHFFGTICHTGEKYLIVDVKGNVTRCHNFRQPLYYLGNVTKGTFRRFSAPQPCLAKRCVCTAPANRNMICYGQKAGQFAIMKGYCKGIFTNLPYLPVLARKVFRVLLKGR